MSKDKPKPKLRARPITFRGACAAVTELHRHHKAPRGLKFAIQCERYDTDTDAWVLCGVVMVGRPVARAVCQHTVLEVTRLATDGTYNVCSFLYSRAARVADAMGCVAIQTYILESEPGTSLRAAGWTEEETARQSGKGWNNRAGRRPDQPTCKKRRFRKYFPKNGVMP